MGGCGIEDSLPSWADAITSARARLKSLTADGQLARGTGDRYLRAFEAFSRYAGAHGERCDGVSPEICRRYIYADVSVGQRPSASTSRVRLAAVRDAYRGLIEAGLCAVDPTAGLAVEGHVGVPAVDPLTPSEVDRLQSASRLRPIDTLRPAVVAAALSGASHSEIAGLVIADLDLPRASLRLGHGTSATRLVAIDQLSMETFRGASVGTAPTPSAAGRLASRRRAAGTEQAGNGLPAGKCRPDGVDESVPGHAVCRYHTVRGAASVVAGVRREPGLCPHRTG